MALKKELILLLAALLIVLAALAVIVFFFGPAIQQQTTGSFNFNPGSSVGSKIAQAADPNPLRNVSLNPFSDRS